MLSDDSLQAEVGTFIMGGFETTAHSLSFTLFCIATSPGVQDKIVAELAQHRLLSSLLSAAGGVRKPTVVPSHSRTTRTYDCEEVHATMQYDDIAKLSYLNCVIKEAMRMYPVVAGLPRYQLGCTKICSKCLLSMWRCCCSVLFADSFLLHIMKLSCQMRLRAASSESL